MKNVVVGEFLFMCGYIRICILSVFYWQ